ncbi:hypothetical protein GXN76_08260 [Kroppenstedtia pulmonis]|uniref:SMI1/KNR4 family protein n=1 Tax=Kroppenstedtia pulmonis TaxID=1380685 RepID=A0A7D3XRS1_9BACL|nr:hypothetical protein [Kroppenstedtia pulmonis]QKG84468.1 hypothetical protein GXN76_08260 [Kroppenstedtia pulmonis]
MNKINWKYDEGLVGEKAVKKTEELLNTRLPEDFEKIATENDCGIPHPGRYSFNDGERYLFRMLTILGKSGA